MYKYKLFIERKKLFSQEVINIQLTKKGENLSSLLFAYSILRWAYLLKVSTVTVDAAEESTATTVESTAVESAVVEVSVVALFPQLAKKAMARIKATFFIFLVFVFVFVFVCCYLYRNF